MRTARVAVHVLTAFGADDVIDQIVPYNTGRKMETAGRAVLDAAVVIAPLVEDYRDFLVILTFIGLR